jgi:hypothetical protein
MSSIFHRSQSIKIASEVPLVLSPTSTRRVISVQRKGPLERMEPAAKQPLP